ncbi:hypothetical protein LshimejAT787_0410170 [Lyophyllum shimeji]|uniref:Uncharacterized protein n=1 Tax=Lyophyllum shimeji TaxID=47721 RepID=A0A9P3PMD5_LYOSH|nr:hypothetical protein LshimejAT787_0410170 [Lyophyllum shimeji]
MRLFWTSDTQCEPTIRKPRAFHWTQQWSLETYDRSHVPPTSRRTIESKNTMPHAGTMHIYTPPAMSKTNSPWSVVGMLMSAPRLRSTARRRKDKGKTEPGNNQSTAQPSEVARPSPEATVVPAQEPAFVSNAATPASGEAGESSTAEQIPQVVTRPATPEEHDNGWTTVAAQEQPGPAASTGSADSQPNASLNADDDIVDVLSQSVSVDFFDQQAQAPPGTPPHVASEIERKEAAVAVIESEKKDLESRLESVLEELASAVTRNAELDGENRRQAQKLQDVEAEMQKWAQRGGQEARREVEEGQQRIRALEADLYEQGEALKGFQNDVQSERRVWEERQNRLEEMTERNGDLEERIGRLLEERHVIDGELQELRGRNATTNDTLEALLADLSRAEEERDGAHGELDAVLQRIQDLEEARNSHLLEERQAVAEELQGLRGVNAQTKCELDAVLVDLAKAKKEWESIQARLEESEGRNKDLEARNRRLVDERQAADRELEVFQGLQTKTANTLKAALAELKSASHQKGELVKEVDRQAGELAGKERAIQDLRRSQAEIARQPNHRQLDVLERRNRMLVDQLRRQSEQLRQQTLSRREPGAQPLDISPKGETLGGVASMVDRLNSEIFQTAAHMADSLDFTNPATMNAQEIRAVVDRASVTLGRPLALVLQATSAQPGIDFNPLPVQIGLQACLISCCERIATSWCPGHWDYGDFLAAIYLRVAGSTPPTVAAKWRALTERQLKNPSDSTTQAEMEDYILRNLVDALVIAGWRRTQSNGRDLLTKFRERLGQIVKLALRLNMSLGDNWELMTVHPNELFEAENMDDAYDGAAEKHDGDHVVCTTELGLKTAGSVVVRPKVVLRATLTEETGYDAF